MFMPKNIKADFVASSLFLFNLNKVLRNISKSPTELNIPKANEVGVGFYPQNTMLSTPVMPVSAEGFMLLQNLIKQDIYISKIN